MSPPTFGHWAYGLLHARNSNIMENVVDAAAYDRLQKSEAWRDEGYESAASAALDKGILTFKLLDW
jgi:hypothetical protein